ncbi:MAG: flagellar biosynthetic protein FlhF [Fibrobacteres bacterium]|nr:flagellar biosynthetic protein FlhF [Fibrobacterota bacterium]
MKMKSYQADTMQEALGLVKEEMGPDAVILKSRRTTRKVLGKTQACFEVTAALEESLFARPAPVVPDRQAPREAATLRGAAPRSLSPAAARLAALRPMASTAANGPRASATAPATPGQYDWKGSLRRVDEDGNASPIVSDDRRVSPQALKTPERRAANTVPASREKAAQAADADANVIEMLRNELKEMKARADQPSREMKDLKEEIKAMMESAAARTAAQSGSRQMESKTFARSAMSPATAWIPNVEFQGLQESLIEMDVEPALAAEAVGAAYSEFRAAYKQEGPGEAIAKEPGEREASLLARNLAERIRVTGGIRLRPGRPTTVALVGPTGVGKTTTLAKLAALAKIQQGKKVGIISADSFRMGANEQLELFGRTAGIPVKPVFSPADVVQAQREFAGFDLILVDTAGRSHTHKEMWRELQGLLHCLAPDEVHLVLSGPTRMRELWHQYGLYRDLGAGSIIFTKLDECLSLGCLYNLARRAEAPLSYLCNGQVIPDHIMLARTDTVASAIAGAARASLASAQTSSESRTPSESGRFSR